MGKRELKTKILLLILVLLVSLTFQRKSSSPSPGDGDLGARRFGRTRGCVNTPGTACHDLGSKANDQQPLDHVENVDGGEDHDEAAPGGDDYDFYRQYGDVPSPGVGH